MMTNIIYRYVMSSAVQNPMRLLESRYVFNAYLLSFLSTRVPLLHVVAILFSSFENLTHQKVPEDGNSC